MFNYIRRVTKIVLVLLCIFENSAIAQDTLTIQKALTIARDNNKYIVNAQKDRGSVVQPEQRWKETSAKEPAQGGHRA